MDDLDEKVTQWSASVDDNLAKLTEFTTLNTSRTETPFVLQSVEALQSAQSALTDIEKIRGSVETAFRNDNASQQEKILPARIAAEITFDARTGKTFLTEIRGWKYAGTKTFGLYPGALLDTPEDVKVDFGEGLYFYVGTVSDVQPQGLFPVAVQNALRDPILRSGVLWTTQNGMGICLQSAQDMIKSNGQLTDYAEYWKAIDGKDNESSHNRVCEVCEYNTITQKDPRVCVMLVKDRYVLVTGAVGPPNAQGLDLWGKNEYPVGVNEDRIAEAAERRLDDIAEEGGTTESESGSKSAATGKAPVTPASNTVSDDDKHMSTARHILTNAPEGTPIEQPPPDHVPAVPDHFGKGVMIYVGPPGKSATLHNAVHFNEESLLLLKKSAAMTNRQRRDYAKYRAQCARGNVAMNVLRKDFACYALQKQTRLGWDDHDSGCNECQHLKSRDCFVFINEEVVWYKHNSQY